MDWNGEESAHYTAKHLRQGYECGMRTDVDYTIQCEKEHTTLCEKWPHLAEGWKKDWEALRKKCLLRNR